ncbi:MAG: hypothetical protein AB3N23_21725 [Paracoccaceae bacterium]
MRIARTLITTALLALGSTASAQELKDFGFTAGWQILIDPALGNGCLIQQAFSPDSVVRLGYDAVGDRGYITVFDRNWGQIKDGESYPVTFDLDGERFEATAKGFYLGKVPGAGIFFTDRSFVDAIAQRKVMSIYGQNGKVTDIDLRGSANALKHARECQAAQG